MNDPWIVFYHISEGTAPKSKAATITVLEMKIEVD
jgi:hypothetical protein